MPVSFADLPSRVQKIAQEEFDCAQVWFPGSVHNMDQLLNGLDRKASAARAAIWYRLFHYENETGARPMSYSKIGIMFDRDHTSIRAAVLKHVDNLMDWSLAKNKFYHEQRVNRQVPLVA